MSSGFETPLWGKGPSPSSGSEGGPETRRRSASTPAAESTSEVVSRSRAAGRSSFETPGFGWMGPSTDTALHQVSEVLTFLVNTHAKKFGFGSEILDRRAVFIIHSFSYGGFSDGLLEALPIGPLEITQTRGCSCRHIAKRSTLRCSSASQTLLVVGRCPVLPSTARASTTMHLSRGGVLFTARTMSRS
ncbi:unnamed protein product [Ectocarpus sp. 12 AP-2014]